MKTVAKMINAFLLIVYFVVVLFALSGLFGVRIKVVTSGSMEPYIKVGSLVVTVPVEFGELSVKDDVLYKLKNGTYVTHRIIEIDKEKGVVRTKGTANDGADPAVSADDVIGKVVFSVNGGGYVAAALSKKWVKLCACLFLVFLTAISVALDCKARRKEKI